VADFDWQPGLTVGQVAKRSGSAPSAVRFYERQGLLTSDCISGSQVRYRADVLCRLAMMQACQRVGLSLAEIRYVLSALPDSQGAHACGLGTHRGAPARRGRIRLDVFTKALDGLSVWG
jgi:DNA-binding transcriptional MerR regulator